MDNRSKEVKHVYELCAGANFEMAFENLKNLKSINDSIALKIIINICNGCASNTQNCQKLSDRFLHDILLICIPYIRDPSDSQLLSFSQAIFHILKMLLEKRSCDCIVNMENIWLPHFLHSKLSEKIIDNYKKIATLIFNFLVRETSKTITIDSNLWLKLNMLILRICKYLPQSSFMKFSFGCLSTGKTLKISSDAQEEFYSEILQIIHSEENQCSETVEYVFLYTFTVMINMMSIQNYENARLFHSKVACFWKKFDAREYIYLHRVLNIPILLSGVIDCNMREEIIQCTESLILVRNILSSKAFQKVITCLDTLVGVAIKFYKKNGGSLLQNLSSDVLLNMYELFSQLAHFEKRSQSEEAIFQTFIYAEYISSSIKHSINKSGDHPDYYHKKSMETLQIFFKNISKLKQMSSEKWKTAWNILSIPIYNVGVILFKESKNCASYYFTILIQEYMKLDGPNCLKLKFSMLSSMLNAICTLNSHDYRKKMAYSALSIHLCPNDAQGFMMNFINVKYTKVDDLQNATLVSSFKIFDKELRQLLGTNYELSLEEKNRMLLFELRQYKKRWQSKVSMMNALKELYQTAEIELVVNAVIEIFGDFKSIVHADVAKIVCEIIEKYENAIGIVEEIQQKLNLSVLYMLKYKYRFNEVILKNACDMEISMSVDNKEESPNNTECDIVSAYESLTLNVHLRNMAHLDRSLSLLSSFDVESINCIEPFTYKDLYNLLMRISYEYKLNMHNIKNFQALQLALKIAQKEKSSYDIVTTITAIIDCFDIRNPYIKYLTFLADKELEHLDNSNMEHIKAIIMFLIVKSKIFIYIDYKESLRIFNVAHQMLEKDERKEELKIIYSQVLLQNYKLVILPCKLDVQNHKSNTLTTLYMANSMIIEGYRNKEIDGPDELCLLLDTIAALIEHHDAIRCPREVRCHGKEAVVLCQKLVLPLRCVVFLKFLAHADARTYRNDDCNVKLNGITAILSVNKNVLSSKRMGDEGLDNKNNTSEEVRKNTLNIPAGDVKHMCPTSPSVYPTKTVPIDFLRHDEECACYCCICLEYQRLLLENNRLDALLTINQGYSEKSREKFEYAVSLYKKIENRYAYYRDTCNQFLPSGLIPEFDDEFLFTYGSVLHEYSRHLAENNLDSLAAILNNELIQLLFQRRYQFIYLWNEALVQSLLYSQNFMDEQINPIPELDHLSVDENRILKTPENRSSRVDRAIINCSPLSTAPKRRVKKCPFVISPDENIGSKNVIKTPTKIDIFCDIAKNTPSSSNIQIFSESARKTYKKAKANGPLIQDIEFGRQASSSNSSVPLQSSLRVRTKLLTEKLKKNSKKSDINFCENAPVPGQSSEVVRRSQRTKKI